EGDEATQTALYAVTNPRGKSDDDAFDTRSTGQRRMHALRDLIKFALANLDKSGFRGASGAHTQMTVLTDYATLLDRVRNELDEVLTELTERQRTKLLGMLAKADMTEDEDTAYLPDIQETPAEEAPTECSSQQVQIGDKLLTVPPPKTANVDELLNDNN